MRRNILVAAIALAIGFGAPNAIAQHDHHEEPAAAPTDKSADAKAGGMMCGMMAEKEEAAKIVDQLVKSFAAIEAEKDPAALKARLAAHGVLLKELQSKNQTHSQKMEMMHSKSR